MTSLRLGHHELLIRLASGGAANVFLVRDLEAPPPGRLLALKILLPSLASNEEFLRMFFTEAKIAAGLTHSNVVSIAGFGQVDGIHCLAMEYVFGVSLAQVLRASARARRPLTVGVLLRITAAVCDALHYAHELSDEKGESLGLVHRDVTPQNILIGFNGVPKLTDFGIAKATNRGWETQAGIVKGKFSYMSPEQALGKRVDRRSDIFGTGIVLWEALTGRDLFKGSTPMEVLTAIKDQRIEPPSKVVPGLTPIVDPIVMKALKRPQRQRYQTAAEMRDDIEELIRRAGVEIDTAAIAREFAAIYGDEIVDRALALRSAMAGKADLPRLASVLGGSMLEKKHLPEMQSGVSDPDPLGLFSDSVDLSYDRDEASMSGPVPAQSDAFPVKPWDSEPSPPEAAEPGEDLVPYDGDDRRDELDLVPSERVVYGWEDATAMSRKTPAPADDLLNLISEEDATVGALPEEVARRFGLELKEALRNEREHQRFDDEVTIGTESAPDLVPARAISADDDYDPSPFSEPYPEQPLPGAPTTPQPIVSSPRGTSWGVNGDGRPVPRAPSLDLEGKKGFDIPRAPSLDLEETTPVPDLDYEDAVYDPSLEPLVPARAPPRGPPPPPRSVSSLPGVEPPAAEASRPASVTDESFLLEEPVEAEEAAPWTGDPAAPTEATRTPDPSNGHAGNGAAAPASAVEVEEKEDPTASHARDAQAGIQVSVPVLVAGAVLLIFAGIALGALIVALG